MRASLVPSVCAAAILVTAVSAAKRKAPVVEEASLLDSFTDALALKASACFALMGTMLCAARASNPHLASAHPATAPPAARLRDRTARRMLMCEKMWAELFEKNPALGKVPPGCAAIISHFVFMVGSISLQFGVCNLGNALGVPPAIAVAPGVTGMLSVIWFMALLRKSVTGVDGVAGPPLPMRLGLSVVCLIVNANVYRSYGAGASIDWPTVAGLYAAGGRPRRTWPPFAAPLRAARGGPPRPGRLTPRRPGPV